MNLENGQFYQMGSLLVKVATTVFDNPETKTLNPTIHCPKW
jgi:hypothetical protein